MRKVVCPGSFDPVTNGHIDIIARASSLFDEVVVAVGVNKAKAGARLFSAEERVAMLEKVVTDYDNVTVATFEGLLTTFCQEHDIAAIVKGLRAVSDFDYELQMAQMNSSLVEVETVFIPTSPAYSFLASSLVKEVATFGGDVSGLVPADVLGRLTQRLAERRGPAVSALVVRAPEPDDGLSAELAAHLRRLREALQSAPTRRFSAAEVVVDRGDLLAMVDELERAARISVQAAATVVRHRNEVLLAGRNEAAKLVHDAELEQERLVSDTEVFKSATRLAGEREAEAAQRAAVLKRETDAYVAGRLAEFDATLSRTLDAVRRGRERLDAGDLP